MQQLLQARNIADGRRFQRYGRTYFESAVPVAK